jgi:hypothetical protein
MNMQESYNAIKQPVIKVTTGISQSQVYYLFISFACQKEPKHDHQKISIFKT